MNSSQIKFKITLDENHVPTEMEWEATEAGEKSDCKAALISIWDAKENNTMKIDLWTKDMMVDEMKRFFHQTLLTMADSFERATGEQNMAADMRDFSAHFAEKMNLT
ncbi:gliding motility protein GldC, partial [Bacteroidales bacterium AH-315-I05]|nr:gliding motility protein GldC [Bacteroidales bacterium AH-315-I05]